VTAPVAGVRVWPLRARISRLNGIGWATVSLTAGPYSRFKSRPSVEVRDSDQESASLYPALSGSPSGPGRAPRGAHIEPDGVTAERHTADGASVLSVGTLEPAATVILVPATSRADGW